MKSLIILAADKNIQFALKGILSRSASLGIADISDDYDLYVHPNNDPGCYNQCVDFLRPFHNSHQYALVVFDYEGSGQENNKTSNEIAVELEEKLGVSGWGARASVVVINPEIEAWVWSQSPAVENVLGWSGKTPSLRLWLLEKGFLVGEQIKPQRPKEAMESALRKVSKPRSSAQYLKLAESVSLTNCIDESFIKLRQNLTDWFPANY